MASEAAVVLVFDIFTLGNIRGRNTLGTECLAFVKALLDRKIEIIPFVVSSRDDNTRDRQSITRFFSQIPIFASAEIPYAYNQVKKLLYTGDTILDLYKHYTRSNTAVLPQLVYFFDRRQEVIDTMNSSNPNIKSRLVTGEGFWDRVFQEIITPAPARLTLSGSGGSGEEPNTPFTRLHEETMSLYRKSPGSGGRRGNRSRKSKSKGKSKARKTLAKK